MGTRKTFGLVKAKKEKINKLIAGFAPYIVTIKQCNKMLEIDPTHQKSVSERDFAATGLNDGVSGLLNQIGEFDTLVDKLEQQFNDQGNKKAEGADACIAAARTQSGVWLQYEQSLKAALADMEATGAFVNEQF